VKRRGLSTPEGRAYQKHMAKVLAQRWHRAAVARAANGADGGADGGAGAAANGGPTREGNDDDDDDDDDAFMPVHRNRRKKPELLHGVLLPHEVAAMKQTFSIALHRQAQKGGTDEGLEKKGFKALLKEMCKDAGIPAPSGRDLDIAYEIADDNDSGKVCFFSNVFGV